ncbi:SLC13 family permease [Bifidobacterium simiarum]|uniref:Anion transporter n=1 Tax=Bifidobacterium simiarum TaxID=2045441 RepID=A0A2M9HF14_9BIFI|nr:SLC13 family permease [Bifidobacterium simiarum]PJM75392.1 anion transporter [Bifidobacterium simiarum]
MQRWIIETLKRETVLVVAAILAVISCFIVPPDDQYVTYVHWNTISQLVCLMLVVCGLQRVGVFRIIGAKLLGRVRTARGLVLTLVALPFFSGMFVTNDVALVTFVPFAIAVLIMADMERQVCLVVTLMTLGANLGSMFTPIGNAHNLYLKAVSGMGTMEFLAIMAPYSGLAAVLLCVITWFVFGGRRVSRFEGLDAAGIEQSVLAPDPSQAQPDEIRITGYGAGYGGWRAAVYAVLFVVCLLGVNGVLPLWLMVVIVVAAFLFCDRRAFAKVDWGLPLTFCAFFMFIGNMKRVPAFYELAQSLVGGHPLELGVAFSQVISNVPTTLLLSGFSDAWRPLIIGTNLGGMGTLIASMASLISYKAVASKYPHSKGRYLGVYTGMNVVFLIALVGLAQVIE